MKFSQPDVLKLVSAEFLHDSEPAGARRQYLISVVPARLIFFYYNQPLSFSRPNPSDISPPRNPLAFHFQSPCITGQLNSKPFAWRDKTRPLQQNFPLVSSRSLAQLTSTLSHHSVHSTSQKHHTRYPPGPFLFQISISTAVFRARSLLKCQPLQRRRLGQAG